MIDEKGSKHEGTYLADLALTIFRHANVWVGAETCLAEDGCFGFFGAGDGGTELTVSGPGWHREREELRLAFLLLPLVWQSSRW